jgi:hypothetical protein
VSQAHSPLLLEPRSAKFFLRFRLLPLVCLSSRPSCASQICLCYARHSGFRMIFLRFDDSMVERVSRRFRFRFKRQPAINDTVKTNNKVPAGLDTRHSPLGSFFIVALKPKTGDEQTRYLVRRNLRPSIHAPSRSLQVAAHALFDSRTNKLKGP